MPQNYEMARSVARTMGGRQPGQLVCADRSQEIAILRLLGDAVERRMIGMAMAKHAVVRLPLLLRSFHTHRRTW